MERTEDALDRAFMALADPVRRAIVARLSRGAATVNELAEPFPFSTQAISRHIAVLQSAGLISRSRDAQRRPCHLEPAALETLTAWIDTYRLRSEERYRRLDGVLDQIVHGDRSATDAAAVRDPGSAGIRTTGNNENKEKES